MIVENDDVKVFLEIECEDSAGNYVPMPVSSLHDYQVYLYAVSGFKKKLLFTYGKSLSGKNAIQVSGTPNNEVSVVVNRELTRLQGAVRYFLELKVQVDATSDFIDSKANSGVTEIDLFPVKSSANKTGLL
ncbi:MAG: hypothetical protein U0T32_11900 [Chitinophagales bacterium]